MRLKLHALRARVLLEHLRLRLRLRLLRVVAL
jgi:hypothetical protein